MSAARAILALGLGILTCTGDTSRLTPEQETRFAAEGIVHRADNIWFRYTHDAGTRSAGWEDRLGSIVVTRQTVLIHKNQKVGIEITPASRRAYEVARDGNRLRIGAGSGKSREVWSFQPPDDAEGWTRDIRAVIRSARTPGTP
ncbi:MAG TPA: hypothetical protein VJ816_07610 [Gemmatimonadales bacterium]|nr:hypothetical protein [Gemmatimonadales bacterium]